MFAELRDGVCAYTQRVLALATTVDERGARAALRHRLLHDEIQTDDPKDDSRALYRDIVPKLDRLISTTDAFRARLGPQTPAIYKRCTELRVALRSCTYIAMTLVYTMFSDEAAQAKTALVTRPDAECDED